jgi:hypothetical protein
MRDSGAMIAQFIVKVVDGYTYQSEASQPLAPGSRRQRISKETRPERSIDEERKEESTSEGIPD